MKRPKLKDYKNESLKSLSTHQYDLTEWSWWAEDRIKELEQQLSLHGVSQRSELLPAFLERKDFDIITLKTAGTSVLKDWEEYLKAVNCG